jgi:hypothetical protein
MVPAPTPVPISSQSRCATQPQAEVEQEKAVAAQTNPLDAKQESIIRSSATQVAARRRSSASEDSIVDVLRRADIASKQLELLVSERQGRADTHKVVTPKRQGRTSSTALAHDYCPSNSQRLLNGTSVDY